MATRRKGSKEKKVAKKKKVAKRAVASKKKKSKAARKITRGSKKKITARTGRGSSAAKRPSKKQQQSRLLPASGDYEWRFIKHVNLNRRIIPGPEGRRSIEFTMAHQIKCGPSIFVYDKKEDGTPTTFIAHDDGMWNWSYSIFNAAKEKYAGATVHVYFLLLHNKPPHKDVEGWPPARIYKKILARRVHDIKDVEKGPHPPFANDFDAMLSDDVQPQFQIKATD